MTLALIGYLTGTGSSAVFALPQIIYQLGGGVLAGFAFGKFGRKIFRIELEHNGLYFVVSFALVLLCYSVTQLLGANGFMACYVCGIALNAGRYNYQKALGKFHDGVAWLMQVILFILLGLLVYPSKLLYSGDVGLLAALFLMFIARPAATFLCLIRSEFTFKERLFVSWVGLRGGAPIVLATFPLMNGVYESSYMFHIVFFIVLTSVVLQGMTIMPVAKFLKLDAPFKKKPRSPLAIEETGDKEMVSRELVVTRDFENETLAQIKLPKGVLVLMINRDDKIIVPRGNSVLRQGDMITVLGSLENIRECRQIFSE
jgi:cell volume regulation protein A